MCAGNNRTPAPTRLILTSSPANRNSLGKRTAWLLPCLNTLAVFIALSPSASRYVKYIRARSLGARFPPGEHGSQMPGSKGQGTIFDFIGGKGGTRTLDPGIMSLLLRSR